RQLLHRRRHRHYLAARSRKTFAEIEAQHLVDALEPDIDVRVLDLRAVDRNRFRIVPAPRGDRPAVGPQHRSGLDVGKPAHLVALIDDAAGEPGALVAEGNKTLAFDIEP